MAPLRTKNTSRPTPPDNSAEQSGIAQSSQRMRTRPGNANKHPGLVDLEDEDQRGKTKQSGRRGSGVKATKNMNDMDRLVSGMTTDQRSALMKIVQGAMLGNNIPQGTASVTTLEEHHHSIATEQGLYCPDQMQGLPSNPPVRRRRSLRSMMKIVKAKVRRILCQLEGDVRPARPHGGSRQPPDFHL